jgi:hypothetical protein
MKRFFFRIYCVRPRGGVSVSLPAMNPLDTNDLEKWPIGHGKKMQDINRQPIYSSWSSANNKFSGLASNIKASFGVFVSDVVLSQVAPTGDSFEIALVSLSAISLVWCLLKVSRDAADEASASRSGEMSESAAIVGTLVDVLELAESVGVVFVIRIALQYVQTSLTSIHSEAVYSVISLVLFFCFDTFGRIGSSGRKPYSDWGSFVKAVEKTAERPDDALQDTRWVQMVRPITSSISPG